MSNRLNRQLTVWKVEPVNYKLNSYFCQAMRDIIWTIIIIWLVYKMLEVFRSFSSKKTQSGNTNQHYTNTAQNKTNSATTSDENIKGAIRKHLNKEGEYVDFEEIK